MTSGPGARSPITYITAPGTGTTPKRQGGPRSPASSSEATGALDTKMNDGKNVLIYGDVTVYRPQGRVQLVARGIRAG